MYVAIPKASDLEERRVYLEQERERVRNEARDQDVQLQKNVQKALEHSDKEYLLLKAEEKTQNRYKEKEKVIKVDQEISSDDSDHHFNVPQTPFAASMFGGKKTRRF